MHNNSIRCALTIPVNYTTTIRQHTTIRTITVITFRFAQLIKTPAQISMDNLEYEKSKTFLVTGIVDYVPKSVLIRTIVKKTTGKVSAMSFDEGESLTEKITRFDTLVHIVEGKAEVIIDDHSTLLETGEAIIIPANSHNTIKANVRFKMISTVIKSGYET